MEESVRVRYETEQEWRVRLGSYVERMYVQQCELASLVHRLVVCLERAPWMSVSPEVPVTFEAAASVEVPVSVDEALPTWILTDEQVSAVERAVEQEQRVRGQAYGG